MYVNFKKPTAIHLGYIFIIN